MRRALIPLFNLFRSPFTRRPRPRPIGRRPSLELLEDRLTPADASGMVSGLVTVPDGAAVSGIMVKLTGTATFPAPQGTAVSVSTTTDKSGHYEFDNVQPGSYQISYLGVDSFQSFGNSNKPGNNLVLPTPISITGGQSVTENIVFGYLNIAEISNLVLLLNPTPAESPAPPAGAGSAPASSRPNSTPTAAATVPTVNGIDGHGNVVDLNGIFGDPDITNSLVQFNVLVNGVAESFDVKLFDTVAPQTVDNFLDQIAAGDYNNALFTRLVSNFVLQGGGMSVTAGAAGAVTSINAVPVLPAVPNEFASTNAAGNTNATIGTIAMALSGSDPNSGTNQFFFNLNNNSFLDQQDFAVFGQIVPADLSNFLSSLTAFTPTNESGSISAPGVDVTDFPVDTTTPLGSGSFPTNASTSNLFVISSIQVLQRAEHLTYSIVSTTPNGTSPANLVSATIHANTGYLNLSYTAGETGSATIEVQATDQFGAVTTANILVNVATPVPVVTGVTIAPNADYLTNNLTTLTANPTPSPSSTLSYAYQWLYTPNGGTATAIPNETNAALTVADAVSELAGLATPIDVTTGGQFSVQVTPTDSTDPANPVTAPVPFTSNTVTLSGTTPFTLAAPTVVSATIAPNNPSVTGGSTSNATTLTALPISNDGTVVAFAYQWFQNGSLIAGATAQTLNLDTQFNTAPVANDQFSVTISPSNALTGTGTVFTPNFVTVTAVTGTGATATYSFSAPTATVTVTPDSTSNTTTLTANPTPAAGGTVSYTYQWFQNGTAIPGATAQTLNLLTQVASVNANDAFAVQVTPSDGTTTGLPVTSANTFIKNTNPTFSV